MKVIFLDVDGVINSQRTAVASNDNYPWDVSEKCLPMFDHVSVALIRRACRETSAKIVLSSCWRRGIGHKKMAKALDLPMIASTPEKLSATRGEEIAMWLRDNPVEKYVILDDDIDMLDDQLPYFIQVDRYNGVSYDDYKRILEILK